MLSRETLEDLIKCADALPDEHFVLLPAHREALQTAQALYAKLDELAAERDALATEGDKLRRVVHAAGRYRDGVEVWQRDDPEWTEYWWTELCNALDCKDVGEPPLSVKERMAEHAAETARAKRLEAVAEAAEESLKEDGEVMESWEERQWALRTALAAYREAQS